MKEITAGMMTAFNDYVLIRLEHEQEKKAGSIIITTDLNTRDMDRGTIISVGPIAFKSYEKYYDLGMPDVLGKEVLFEVSPATQMYFDRKHLDGHTYRVVRDAEIMVIIDKEEKK